MSAAPKIPSVERLIRALEETGCSHAVRATAARQAIAELRPQALEGGAAHEEFLDRAREIAVGSEKLATRPVINMSGVILHTGIGRARLAQAAVEAITDAAANHAVVEFDLEEGRRGDRQDHVEGLLRELTGAEAALVVNNCAGALVCALTALCEGKEVLISNGQMVEIGGSFRMPDIVEQSGCWLVGVGCTNKTRLDDYALGITDDTGGILRCHPSNFQIVGFTEQPDPADLAEFAHKRNLPLIDDVGSGCLIDTARFGFKHERTLREAVAAGPDVVTASGDKLLGGPQAGLILGTAEAVAQIKRHPLARAMRIDKLTLAGLEATLRLYRDDRAEEIPVWRYASRMPDQVKGDARRLAKAWGAGSVVKARCEMGGGSLPGQSITSWCARLESERPDELARSLRLAETPIIGRVEQGGVLLDPRTAESDEVKAACRILEGLRGL